MQRARIEHERWVRRITWWEMRRGALTAPLMLVGLLVGGAIGYGIEAAARLPSQTRFVGAVLGVLVVGRVVAWQFAHHRLEAARQRYERLSREHGIKTRGG